MEKQVERIIALLAALSVLFAALYVGYAFVCSPQNPVASEIQFEASRVAQGYPLYVDPWKGAWENGSPPSRYYVLYTPVFPTLVGMVSRLFGGSLETVRTVGRTLCVLSWLAFHVPVVVFASRAARRRTLLAATLAAGTFFLTRHAPSMSPDTLATALVCAGVLRAAIKDEIDPLAAVLIMAGPFVKPSCLGGAGGAALVLLLQRRPGWLKGLGAGLATFVAFVGICHVASDGAWIRHITSSTGQPLTFTRWVQEMGGRAVVLGIPHVVIAVLAWKRKTSWLVLGPLLGSIAWSTFMMAKHGSGSHYWFEPTGLALIALSRMPATEPSPTKPANPKWLTLAAATFAVMVAITSWPQFLNEPARVKRHDALVAALRAHIPAGDFVVSTDYEIEMTMNHGHISVPCWQTAFLARNGKFPKEEWQNDLVRPEVKWVALAIDPRSPPGQTNDEQVERMPFYDVLKDQLFAAFEFDAVIGGMFVFKRKL